MRNPKAITASANGLMRLTHHSILHRLVGLLLAVLMPVCCCTTQVLGAALLSTGGAGEDLGRMISPCCGSCTEVDATGSSDSSKSHDGCRCVRGQLETSSVTNEVLEALACPLVAHPSQDPAACWDSLNRIDTEAKRIHGPPEDSGPGVESRRLRRIVVLQV